MIIRRFETKDWESYKECVISQWEDSYTIDKDHRVWCYEYLDPYYHYNYFLFDTNYVVLILQEEEEEGGDIIGFNIGQVIGSKMEVIALYIDPMHRGEGWARALKRALVEEARKLELEKITALNRYDNPLSFKLNVGENWIINQINNDYYRATLYLSQSNKGDQ